MCMHVRAYIYIYINTYIYMMYICTNTIVIIYIYIYIYVNSRQYIYALPEKLTFYYVVSNIACGTKLPQGCDPHG